MLDILLQEGRGGLVLSTLFQWSSYLYRVALKYCCDILKNAFHYTENSNKHPYQQLQVFNSMFVFSDKCCGHARSIGDGSKSMFESTVI